MHQASVKGAGCDCLGLLRGVWRELHGEDAETPPPYSPDWAEARGEESLRDALARHLREIDLKDIAPGDIALFRMVARGPAKHCGIVAERDGALTLSTPARTSASAKKRYPTLAAQAGLCV